jgi:hypothetical protein
MPVPADPDRPTVKLAAPPVRSRDPGADQEGKRFEPQRHRCFEFLHFARDFGTYEGWVPQKTRAKRPRGMQSR